MEIFADEILKQNKITFRQINLKLQDSKELLEALKKLGCFLKPEELFTEVAKRGNGDNSEEDVYDASKSGNYA